MKGYCLDCGTMVDLHRHRSTSNADRAEFMREWENARKANTKKMMMVAMRSKRVGYCVKHFMYALEFYLEDHGDMDDFEMEYNLK